MSTTYFQVDLQVDEFHQKLKFIRGWKKKVKVIFFENKEGKERYRKTIPIDLDRSRIAKNEATYPGNFKSTPSARFEKDNLPTEVKTKRKLTKLVKVAHSFTFMLKLHKKFEVSAYGVCRREVKKY